MKLTQWQLEHDAAWKQVYRAMSYLVAKYGTTEVGAIHILGDAICSIRGEACES
jgi:hypothetical protein